MQVHSLSRRRGSFDFERLRHDAHNSEAVASTSTMAAAESSTALLRQHVGESSQNVKVVARTSRTRREASRSTRVPMTDIAMQEENLTTTPNPACTTAPKKERDSTLSLAFPFEQDCQSWQLQHSSSSSSGASPDTRRRKIRRRRMVGLPFWTFMVAPILFLLVAARPILASEGDRSPEYNDCVDSCNRDSCLVPWDWDDGVAKATKLPLMLRLTFWSCLDDCRYHCTHRVTNEAHERVTHIRKESKQQVEAEAEASAWSRAEQRRRIDELVNLKLATLRRVQKQMVQYHGKWVFIRLFGAQEPLSVLFSLANFYVHFTALDMLRKQVSDAYPLKLIYILHALLSCFAWLWSAIFHTRDKAFTEHMDYFGAGAVVLGGLFFTICRLWRFSPGSMAFIMLARTMGGLYVLHVLYLSFGRFDYGYNMKANITVGVTHSLLWLTYSVRPDLFTQTPAAPEGTMGRLRSMPHSSGSGSVHLHSNGGSPPVPVSTPTPIPPSSSRKARRQLQKLIAFLWLASCLELFDFPPVWRALDAHALWHLATVPLARMWYNWQIDDARECVTSGFWLGTMDPKTAAYLQLPHKTEAAVENVTRAVGPPVMRAVERAREWVGTAAGRSTSAMGNSMGTSSGIEFKALTTKLNDIARGTLGNGISNAPAAAAAALSNSTASATAALGGGAHARSSSINHSNGGLSGGGGGGAGGDVSTDVGDGSSDREKYDSYGVHRGMV